MDITTLANAVTKALAYTENGGAPNLDNPSAGKTGEAKSIFQFTPATWRNDAKEVLGSPSVPLSADAETYVVNEKVKKWLQEGKSVKQIASMWNAGQGEPDAYTGQFSDGSPSVGVNKAYGVKFNVPQYADKVEKFTQEFAQNSQPSQEEQPQDAQAGTPSIPEGNTSDPSTNSSDPANKSLQAVLAIITGAKGKQQQAQPSSGGGLLQSLIPSK